MKAITTTAGHGKSPVLTLLLQLQDEHFEALAEFAYGQDDLTGAGQSDDRESVIEQCVFARMARCGCACCRVNLPALLTADGFDHAERTEGWEPAGRRFATGATYVRQASTAVESGRRSAIGTRRGGVSGPEDAA